MTGLPLTGERTVPGIAEEGYWFARHEAVYRWVAGLELAAGPGLDVGSGEGYGAAILAADRPMIGIELDLPAAAHAARTYPQVSTVCANVVALPVAGSSCALCVSLQVIEHIWDVPGYLTELRRVTRPTGLVVLSTPNRPVFSPGLARGQSPVNPFHVREFDADELATEVIDAGFADVSLFGLHHGPRLRAWEEQHGSIVAAQVEAALGSHWPPGLRGFVASVRADDFAIARFGDPALPADLVQDLVVTAVPR